MRIKDLVKIVESSSFDELEKKYKKEHFLNKNESLHLQHFRDEIYVLSYLYYEPKEYYTKILHKEVFFENNKALYGFINNNHAHFEKILINF